MEAGRELRAPASRATHQRRARQGGSGGGVLARLPALLRARTVHQELAQNQARVGRVRARTGDLGPGASRLYYTLDALGRQDLIAKAYETIQQQHTPLAGDSEEQSFRLQQNFATRNGVSADDFAKAYNSFTVNSNLQRAEQLTQRYHVEGVPLVVVNGKYTTDVAKAGGEAKLIELINDLTSAEHRR